MSKKDTVELDKSEYYGLLNRIKFFQTIVQEISSRKPIQELLDQIIFSSKKLLDSEAATLLLYDRENDLLLFHTMTGGTGHSLKSKSLRIGEGIGGWAAEKRESIIINDCYSDTRFNREFDIASGYHTRNMVCVPMINNQMLIGVIQVINKKGNNGFTKEDLELFEALAAQCAVAIENAHTIELEIKAEHIKHEMDTAWRIQQRFLPAKLPVIKDVEMCIKLKPAKEIGGDYFNVLKIDDENYLFFVADVSGKSISAALIVSTIYSFLHFYFIINKTALNPAEFVESFNKFLITSTTPDKFATAWFGFFNQKTRILKSVNAGHNPPYILRNDSDKIETLTEGGLILGSMELPYKSESVQLTADHTIVFYTDGITEAMNGSEEEFGEKRFEELLLNNRKLNAAELSGIVFEEIKKYRGNCEQSDDITLGILKF